MDATFRTRQIIVTNQQGESMLLLELQIECDACGETAGIIHGHHLATLHYALGRILAARPELCGTVGVVKDEMTFEGVADPGKAQLN